MHAQLITSAVSAAPAAPAPAWEPAGLPWYGRLLFPPALRALYQRCAARPDLPLFAALLQDLHVRYEVRGSDLANIPRQGAAVVVANHPFGLLDGAILADLVRSVRTDVRVLTNYLVAQIPELQAHCIALDPWGGKAAAQFNRRGMRQARQWLQQGGALVTFPAGEVSTWQGIGAKGDAAWTHTASRLARASRAPLVPMFVQGSNSALFHGVGLLHPRLRTLCLPRELLNKRGANVAVRVGRPVWVDRLQDDATATAVARAKTYLLAHGLQGTPLRGRRLQRQRAVAPAQASHIQEAELHALSPSSLLQEDSDFQVWVSRAAAMPKVMQEIGRQRELTFRAVGEGTGAACDLDDYDDRYEHLVLWHKARREVAGGYRVGRVLDLLRAHGPAGIYTASLYHFDTTFFAHLGPALELGRSFVTGPYQRQYGSLLNLWKGLAQYVVRHPQTPILMGPVSVSQRYHKASRQLLARFFAQRCRHPLRNAVQPQRALRVPRGQAQAINSLAAALPSWEELSATVAELEVDGKALPVLMRQYLKLGAELVAFNVDPAFGHCLDGLVLLDLRHAEPRLLKRFMGDAGYASFARHHALSHT